MARKKIEVVALKMLRRRFAKVAVDAEEARGILGDGATDGAIAKLVANEVREEGETYEFGPTTADALVTTGMAVPAERKKAEAKAAAESKGTSGKR